MKDYKWYFIYTVGGDRYVNTCYTLQELCKFLNRRQEDVERDLKKSHRKRRIENKVIPNSRGKKYTILQEDEYRKYILK